MLNLNHATLTRVLHEERIAEALSRHQLHGLPERKVNLLTQLLSNLGNRLVDLGWKLKALVAQRAQKLAEV